MSETRHYTGRLTPTGKTLEEFMEGKEIPEFCENLTEAFDEMYYREYFLVSGMIYKIEDLVDHEYSGFREVIKLHDGSYKFNVRYYDGSCCLSDAIYAGFNKVN